MQTKNQILSTLVFFIILFFTIFSIDALKNHFAQQKKEKIQLMNNCPSFVVERTAGNNQEKTLLPIPIPNLNQEKYQHLITVEHEATLNSNGLEFTVPFEVFQNFRHFLLFKNSLRLTIKLVFFFFSKTKKIISYLF
ncbi:MAG: hypothetical protein ABZF75_01075 [Columbia Basin potato purple top phytoplasma]